MSGPASEQADGAANLAGALMPLTNCHIHTFTIAHVPDRFTGVLGHILRIRPIRRALLAVLRNIDRTPRNRYGRYAQILEVSHNRTQEDVFKIARGLYPQRTRFVVLLMDMEFVGAGNVRHSIDEQHTELRQLRDTYPDLIIPCSAA